MKYFFDVEFNASWAFLTLLQQSTHFWVFWNNSGYYFEKSSLIYHQPSEEEKGMAFCFSFQSLLIICFCFNKMYFEVKNLKFEINFHVCHSLFINFKNVTCKKFTIHKITKLSQSTFIYFHTTASNNLNSTIYELCFGSFKLGLSYELSGTMSFKMSCYIPCTCTAPFTKSGISRHKFRVPTTYYTTNFSWYSLIHWSLN